jgi:hypothetical protein
MIEKKSKPMYTQDQYNIDIYWYLWNLLKCMKKWIEI